jgi:hypothetical protein
VPPFGRIEAIFEPHFSVFGFSCFSPDFAGAVSASWRQNWRNRRRFFLQKNSYTIKSYIFFTGVTVEEKQMSELTPFFSRFDPVFSSDLFGIYLLFSARRIEFDLLSLRIVFFIYIYVFNRVRVVEPDQKRKHSLL